MRKAESRLQSEPQTPTLLGLNSRRQASSRLDSLKKTPTRPPMYFKFLTGCNLLLLALVCGKPPIAWAHAYLASALPADGSTVTQAPREIRIQFTEGVELEFSRIDVKSS